MNVLYWGYRDNTPMGYFRAGQFAPYLPALGITAIYLTLADLGLEAIDWADVIVFRALHTDDGVTERAWDHAAGRAARVYDSDDWDFERPAYAPRHAEVAALAPFLRRMAREADLVTCATPELERRYRTLNPCTAVLRNAVDLSLYEPDEPKAVAPLTALYYGPNSRLVDYFGWVDPQGKRYPGHAAAAVRDAGLRSMWIGCEGDVAPAAFDVVVRYDWDMRRFFRTLGNSGADIGLAPLLETEFNACKSELHWLDMTAAGIPVIGQRLMGGGPYAPIHDGVDGLLARSAGDWRDAVKRLVTNPGLRSDLVAAARERMTTEYDPAKRAAEWADALRSPKGAAHG